MSASEWIAKRRELLAAATEGPWSPEDVYGLVAPTKIDGYTHPVERAEAMPMVCRFATFPEALSFATEHAAEHTCPSWRASGEPCSPYCTEGWVA